MVKKTITIKSGMHTAVLHPGKLKQEDYEKIFARYVQNVEMDSPGFWERNAQNKKIG